MPIDHTFISKVARSIKKEINLELANIIQELKDTHTRLVFLKTKIKAASNSLYLEEYVKLILTMDERRCTVDLDKTIEFKKLINTNRITIYNGNDKQLKSIYNSYLIAFCDEMIKKHSLLKEYKFYFEIHYYTVDNIVYIIKRYFNQLQKHLLLGHSYRFPIIKFVIKIFGKQEYTDSYKNRIDWGKSLKNLKRLAKEHDPELLHKYNKRIINRNQFIAAMKQYNLKWFIYNDKDFNLWVTLYKADCPHENGKYYKVMPANGVMNQTKSQIDFTDEHDTVEEIIETNELMFRDKIRALERVDMDYCLKTFKNDRKSD